MRWPRGRRAGDGAGSPAGPPRPPEVGLVPEVGLGPEVDGSPEGSGGPGRPGDPASGDRAGEPGVARLDLPAGPDPAAGIDPAATGGDADPGAGSDPGADADPGFPVGGGGPVGAARSRGLSVLILLAVLAAGLIADRVIGTPAATASSPTIPGFPSTAPAGSLSSAWFCPALPAAAGGPAVGRIVVANPTGAVLTGTLTVVPSAGSPMAQSLELQPYTRTTYRLELIAPGPYAAATVSLDGTGGAVEDEVQGSLGESITPCTTSSSDHWYFAAGSTEQTDTELISLYNPYPAPAIADLSFVTDLGPTSPDSFQGVVVPGGGFNVIDVGARVRLRAFVATAVDVRSGRLVAEKLELQKGAASAPNGPSLTLGATAPGLVWYYPDGAAGAGLDEHFEIFNPGATEARVQLAPTLDQGSADPFDLTVPADDKISLDIPQQARIPPGIGQSWVLSSANGVPVVAERVIDAVSPAVRAGVSDTTGAPRLSTGWEFPAGSAAAGSDEWIVLFNPGNRTADVTLSASGLGLSQPVAVGGALLPGTRRAVDIGVAHPQAICVIDVASDVPVVAERAQFTIGAPGLSDSVGIPAAP